MRREVSVMIRRLHGFVACRRGVVVALPSISIDLVQTLLPTAHRFVSIDCTPGDWAIIGIGLPS